MSRGAITVRAIDLADPALPGVWERLIARSDTRPITQTVAWLRTWDATFPVERPLLLAAERGGETVAIAPWFEAEGMVHFLGIGEADYHDLLGDAHDPEIVGALLAAARERTRDFEGFKLHFIPEGSRTGNALEAAAGRLGLQACVMNELVTVVVDVAADPEGLRRAVSRSMRKREAWFTKQAEIVPLRLTTAAAVLPYLPEFFELHVARWRSRGLVSDFERADARRFLERWIETSAARGWLHALRLEWRGRLLGMEFSWRHDGVQHCGPWIFPPDLARRSPGQVLLRHSVLDALEAGVRAYDQGLGDQEYKFRLPSRSVNCITWGIYPATGAD